MATASLHLPRGDYHDYYLPPDEDITLFEQSQPRNVWRKVALAVGLLASGSLLLFLGLGLYLRGVTDSNGLAMVVIGGILFLPGFYHTRIAFLAWRKHAGYSLSAIPDF